MNGNGKWSRRINDPFKLSAIKIDHYRWARGCFLSLRPDSQINSLGTNQSLEMRKGTASVTGDCSEKANDERIAKIDLTWDLNAVNVDLVVERAVLRFHGVAKLEAKEQA